MTAITLRCGSPLFQNHGRNGRSTATMLRLTAPAATLGTMPDSPLLTAAAVAVIVLAIAVVVGAGIKLLRSFRELGTDAERATYNTLHTASSAGQHLRTGPNPPGAPQSRRPP